MFVTRSRLQPFVSEAPAVVCESMFEVHPLTAMYVQPQVGAALAGAPRAWWVRGTWVADTESRGG